MFFLLLLFPCFLFCADDAGFYGNDTDDLTDQLAELVDSPITTDHLYRSENLELPYQAKVGMLPLINGKGEELAYLGYIAYFAEEGEERPITFIFPGGPGGSCGAEVLCTVGPRRMELPQEGKRLLPPYRLIDNPESLLPWTDLVFVDPVETGYSKLVESDEGDLPNFPFFNTDGDIIALSHFIRTFLTLHEKWNCPKYVGGFSYGASRCCGLSESLLHSGIALHGILLLSPAIDFATLLAQHNQFLPDALLIPTFAATAWIHGRLWPDLPLEEVVNAARRFSYDDYLPSLLQPTRLSAMAEDYFYAKLSQLIGLDETTVRRYSGRFDEGLFTQEFFAGERKTLGGLDTRYSADWSRGGKGEEDPSYDDMQGIPCAFKTYLQKELKVPLPLIPYVDYASLPWNFSTYDSIAWPELLQRVRRTLVRNPEMGVFTGCGYFDCRTPFAATEYCFDHLDLPSSYRGNVQFAYYPAGHGFIFDLPSLKKLKNDLVSFYSR